MFAENMDGQRFFVVHTQVPRFIAEFCEGSDGYTGEVIQWIDHPREETAGDLASTVARLMREAGEALHEYDARLDADLDEAADD